VLRHLVLLDLENLLNYMAQLQVDDANQEN
jgi:hypothetical protein